MTEDKKFSFDTLEINSCLKRAVREMGFEEMTPIQAQAIPMLLDGGDVIGQAQTGTGKTAAWGLPILDMVDPHDKSLQAIILCPTRELAMQAANELRNFAKYMHDVKVLPVYGGQDIMRQILGLKGVQIVVGTPGRVMDHMRRHTIKMDNVRMVVLDEADEMLNMGFLEDMETILGEITQPHQTCLFSATMPDEILELTDRFQESPELIRVTKQELTVDSITQYYYAVKHEYKTLALSRLLSYYNYERSIIFCNTKAKVDELSAQLQKEGYAAEGLHGDLTQKQRDSVMNRFRSGHLNILIATDIAARGIDVDDVEAVFNYDIPLETEYYVHRIGRTGRAGKDGVSHSLCRSRDFRKMHEIEAVCHAVMEEKKIPSIAEIKEAKERALLEKVMGVLNEGRSGSLIPLVKQFCEENGLPLDAFAAACLKMHMGEMPVEAVEIDLPESKGAGRGGRDREGRRGRNGEGRFGRRDGDDRSRGRDRGGRFGGRDDKFGSREKAGRGQYQEIEDWSDREEYRKTHKNRGTKFGTYGGRDDGRISAREGARRASRGENRKGGSTETGRRAEEAENFKAMSGVKGKFRADEKKSEKQKRKERSRREIEKAVKDVRLNGSPWNKKKKRR